MIAGAALQVGVDYRATLARAVSEREVKEKIAGQPTDNLRSIVFGISGVEKLTASLWPAWARSVPEDEKRIFITID